jgi:hypothetical protein
MTLGYSLWYMHGETVQGSAVPSQCPSHPSVTNSAAGSIEQVECTEQGGGLEQGVDMHAILDDAFGVHEVGEAFSSQPQEVNEGTSGRDTLKYHELLKTVEMPLHPGRKHSKLSATVHMYNLKCIGGISNKIFLIFSSLLVSYCLLAMRPCQLIHTRRRVSSVSWVSGMRRFRRTVMTVCYSGKTKKT